MMLTIKRTPVVGRQLPALLSRRWLSSTTTNSKDSVTPDEAKRRGGKGIVESELCLAAVVLSGERRC
jgi:hypothetical protein